MKRICIWMILCLLIAGCGAEEEPEFVKVIETYPPAASADFALPQGYAFADETTASIVRIADNQIVGGILDIGITEAELELTGHDAPTDKYLMSLGYMCEYISMNADGYKAVSLYITDEGSEERRETSRYLFPMDGKSYDLWFDHTVIAEEEKTVIRRSVMGK